jgi:DNA-binding transcriptional LysR family regulator
MTNGIDFRHLRYFTAVADTLSFTRAAERLEITQPAVTLAMRELETRLGATLLDRSARGMRLTPAGEVFLRHARSVLAEAQTAIAAIRVEAGAARPVLRVGFYPRAALELTTPIIDRYSEAVPGVALRWHECNCDPSAGLRDGSTDVAFARLPFDTQGLRTVTLFDESRVVALSRSHPLAGRPAVSIRDLIDEPIAGYASDDQQMNSWWLAEEHRDTPAHVVMRARSLGEQLEVVSLGEAIALTTVSAARYFPRPGVAYVPVHDLEPSRLVVAWRTDQASLLVRRFVEIALRTRDDEAELVATITGAPATAQAPIATPAGVQ